MQKIKAARRAAKHEPRLYPLVGMEEPRREWNGWSLYRHGQKSILDRYLITPKPGVPVLECGVTVLDALLSIGVAAFMLLLVHAIGAGFDGYLDSMGW